MASSSFTLYLGTRHLSSWSLRPFLVCRQAGLQFETVVIELDQPGTRSDIRQHSPSGRVPALRHGDVVIWDSLSICEYVNELHPEAQLWPRDPTARAVARSVSAEMHSGFQKMREIMSMNMRLKDPERSKRPEVQEDVARVKDIVADCRARYGRRVGGRADAEADAGPFLFGRFSIADAMYAPVISRFRSYGVELEGDSAAWAEAVWELPAMREWREAARATT